MNTEKFKLFIEIGIVIFSFMLTYFICYNLRMFNGNWLPKKWRWLLVKDEEKN